MKKTISIITLLVLVLLGVFYALRENDTEIPVSPTPVEEASDFTIVAFGDSLTAGYGLPLGEGYPAQLESLLREEGYGVRVINAGVSGETTRGNRERAAFIRAQNPDVVLLGIGGNDALRFFPLEETRANMETTIETLQAGEGSPVIILLRMQAPENAGSNYKVSFDALTDELARTYGLTVTPFITEEVFLNEAYKLDDGIHLNEGGYEKIVREYLIPTLRPLLVEMKSRSSLQN
jgi:acyl-CoA thioesterase I